MKTHLVLFAYVMGIAVAVAALPVEIGFFHVALIFIVSCIVITFAMTYHLKDRISSNPWKWHLPFVAFFIVIIWFLMLFTDGMDSYGQRNYESGYRYRMHRLGNWMREHGLFSSEKLVEHLQDAVQNEEATLFFIFNIEECVNELVSKGSYSPDSQKAEQLRKTLLCAAETNNKEVSAVSVLALADMSMVDSHLDVRKIYSMLVDMVADASLPADLRRRLVIMCGNRYVEGARLALENICCDYAIPDHLRHASHFALKCLNDSKSWDAEDFANGVVEYWHRYGELPTDIQAYCECPFLKAGDRSYGYRHFIESVFVFRKVSFDEVAEGAAFLKTRQGYYWNVDEANSLLTKYFSELKVTVHGTNE